MFFHGFNILSIPNKKNTVLRYLWGSEKHKKINSFKNCLSSLDKKVVTIKIIKKGCLKSLRQPQYVVKTITTCRIHSKI